MLGTWNPSRPTQLRQHIGGAQRRRARSRAPDVWEQRPKLYSHRTWTPTFW
jgi:hypothetical protein